MLVTFFNFYCTLSFYRYADEDLTNICLTEKYKQTPIEDYLFSKRLSDNEIALSKVVEEITETDDGDSRIKKAQTKIFSGSQFNQFSCIYKDLLPREVWKELIIDEAFDEEKIKYCLLNSRFLNSVEQRAHLKLRYFYKLRAGEFEKLYQTLLDEVANSKFANLIEISEVLGTLHFLECEDLISPINSQIISVIETQITNQAKSELNKPVTSYKEYMQHNMRHPFSLDSYNSIHEKIIKQMADIEEKANNSWYDSRYTSLKKGDLVSFFGILENSFFQLKQVDDSFKKHFRNKKVNTLMEDLLSCLDSPELTWNNTTQDMLSILMVKSYSENQTAYDEWLNSLSSALKKMDATSLNQYSKLTIYRINYLLKTAKNSQNQII